MAAVFNKGKAEKFFKKLLGHFNYIEPCNWSVNPSFKQNWGWEDGKTRYHAFIERDGKHIRLECYSERGLTISFYDCSTLEIDSNYALWHDQQKYFDN